MNTHRCASIVGEPVTGTWTSAGVVRRRKYGSGGLRVGKNGEERERKGCSKRVNKKELSLYRLLHSLFLGVLSSRDKTIELTYSFLVNFLRDFRYLSVILHLSLTFVLSICFSLSLLLISVFFSLYTHVHLSVPTHFSDLCSFSTHLIVCLSIYFFLY